MYMICKQIVCREHFLNEPELICLRIVKGFLVLVPNVNNLI